MIINNYGRAILPLASYWICRVSCTSAYVCSSCAVLQSGETPDFDRVFSSVAVCVSSARGLLRRIRTRAAAVSASRVPPARASCWSSGMMNASESRHHLQATALHRLAVRANSKVMITDTWAARAATKAAAGGAVAPVCNMQTALMAKVLPAQVQQPVHHQCMRPSTFLCSHVNVSSPASHHLPRYCSSSTG